MASNYLSSLVSPALKSLFPITSQVGQLGQSLYNAYSNTKPPGDMSGSASSMGGLSNQIANQQRSNAGGYSTENPYSTTQATAARYNNYTPPQYPKPPTIDYSTPYVPQISWDDALSRAKARYEPQYQSAVLSQDKLASDQRERLAQMLGARGYANPRGGMRQTGEGNITQEQAMALDSLRNQYDSTINQYAGDIYNQESTGAAQRLSSLLADRNAKNQTALQQYGTDLGAAMQKDQNENNKYNSYFDFLYKIFAGED